LSEKNSRSIAKAVSYRVFGSIVTFAIALLLTGDAVISSAVGVADLFAKSILFYLHERLWNKIDWGRTK
jgi:uncharacterized membrane protein